MNDELRLQKMLEEATAPGSGVPEGLDAETASLREAWLALGRTLAAAEAAAGPPREVLQVPLSPPPRSWAKVSVFALAASLLILASVFTVSGLMSDPARHQPDEVGRDNEGTAPSLAAQDQGTTLVEGWDWDQAIDTEISNTARGVVWFGQDSRASTDSLPLTGQEILEIQTDFNDSTF